VPAYVLLTPRHNTSRNAATAESRAAGLSTIAILLVAGARRNCHFWTSLRTLRYYTAMLAPVQCRSTIRARKNAEIRGRLIVWILFYLGSTHRTLRLITCPRARPHIITWYGVRSGFAEGWTEKIRINIDKSKVIGTKCIVYVGSCVAYTWLVYDR